MKNVKPLDELTGIRFFAALHVVFYHNYAKSGSLAKITPSWLLNIFNFGDAAVSFFFILSGFILTYVYVDKNNKIKTSYKKFYWARFSRLYPMYIFALLLDLPRGLTHFFTSYELKEAFIKTFISLGAYVSMIQAWHPRVSSSWNVPGWSISNEAFFYLVFPLSLLFIMKLKKHKLVIICWYLFPLLLYLISIKFYSFNLLSEKANIFWRSFPMLRVGEFLIGIVLGKLFIKNHHVVRYLKKHETLMGLFFWLVLFISLALMAFNLPFPKMIYTHTFLLPCFSVIILLLASVKIPYTLFLRHEKILLLGSASYTMYIIHQPLLYYVDMFLRSLNIGIGPFYFTFYLTSLISVSVFLYKYLEMPLQQFIRSKL